MATWTATAPGAARASGEAALAGPAGTSRAPRPVPLDLRGVPSAGAATGPATRDAAGDRPAPSSPAASDAEEAGLMRLIDYLTAPEHADADPRLMAVGYELEALLAIYPGGVRLSSAHSRAPSRASVESARPRAAELAAAHEAPAAPAGPSSSAGALLASLAAAPAARDGLGGLPSRPSSDSLLEAAVDPAERIRYEIALPAWEAGDAPAGGGAAGDADEPPRLRVLVSLPPGYPATSPPQLQLLGRYLGAFPIDAGLFGDVTRTYITSAGVAFSPGDVCVFEGLQHVQGLARAWLGARLAHGAAGERARREMRQGAAGRAFADAAAALDSGGAGESGAAVDESAVLAAVAAMALDSAERAGRASSAPASSSPALPPGEAPPRPSPLRPTFSYSAAPARPRPPAITSSPPIVDRRSTFVGHAARVADERDVPLVIHELLGDRRIAKAAHPAIYAYRIVRDVGGVAGRVIDTDYDDDGETQAGARLAHLLDTLALENVLVVVSRWYGGTLLGPDRFKHINQAARDALELAGLLDDEAKGGGGKGKARRR